MYKEKKASSNKNKNNTIPARVKAENNGVKSKLSSKSILLQVDDATKGIMEEIQSGITDDLVNKIEKHECLINELKEKIDETYELEKTNNKLLKSIEKQLKRMSESEE